MRTFALAVLFGSLASAAAARDDDPVREKLDKAKADYLAAVEKVKELVEKPFADAEDAARKKADQKKLDELEEARKAFETWHDLPDGRPFDPARGVLAKARRDVIDAHKAGIKEYTKAGKRDQADAVVKELNQLQEGWDALQVGSVWAGKVVVQVQGQVPFNEDARVTVTDRQGPAVSIKIEWTYNGAASVGKFEATVEAGRLVGKPAQNDGVVKGRVVGERLFYTVDRKPAGKAARTVTVDVRLQKR